MVFSDADLVHARKLHAANVIVLGHTDILPDVAYRQSAGEAQVITRRHLPGLKAAGVTAVCDHVAGDASYLMDMPFRNKRAANRLKFGMQGIAATYREAETSDGEVTIATTVEHIRHAKKNGQLAIVLCFEGAAPMEDDPGLLALYHRLGVRCIGLTHDIRNLLADGIRVGGDYGLTNIGREAVREMNRLGILIDVSHISRRGLRDVLELSSAPIQASHTNCAALCDDPYNLPDDLLRAIAESGGVVGFHAMSALITSEGRAAAQAGAIDELRRISLDQLLNQIQHMVEVMGIDHVAAGPDIMEYWPREIYRELWRATHMPSYQFVYPSDFDSYSKLPNVTAGLVARGFTDREIIKVMGGNLLRLFDQVWRSDGAAATVPRSAL